MNSKKIIPILVFAASMLGACSSMPTTTTLLDQTRSDFSAAQSNPNVASYAPLELRMASEALDQANAAAAKKESMEAIDRLAYVAKQKIALSQEVAKQKAAEASVANSGKVRDQVRLDQRTAEADQAKMKADQATAAAKVAEAAATTAQQQTTEAQRKAQEAEARAAQLETQLAGLSAKKTERGMVVTLGDVLFGTDQARLTPDGMRTVQQLAGVLQQNPQRTVLVEGFTDITGSKQHNLDLSQRRASAVRSALQAMNIGRDRVAIQGYGDAYPVASNDNATDRQLNRRVEIVLSDESGKVPARVAP